MLKAYMNPNKQVKQEKKEEKITIFSLALLILDS